MHWWWLSFSDPRRRAGEQFQGAAIVGPAAHLGQAVELAQLLGIAPPGEVRGFEIPDDIVETIEKKDVERLLSFYEAIALWQLIDTKFGAT